MSRRLVRDDDTDMLDRLLADSPVPVTVGWVGPDGIGHSLTSGVDETTRAQPAPDVSHATCSPVEVAAGTAPDVAPRRLSPDPAAS